MKKLMLTTAIASVLTTAAIAQTTITGELRINYKDVSMPKGSAGNATADTNYGFGSEQQINFTHKGKLKVGGIDYAAGFSMENDGEQTGTLFNENVYIDLTNASSGTTVSFGRDHIQRSDSDYSATNLVGFTPNELSQITGATNAGTWFAQNIGAAPSQNMGAAILQKTTLGTFSYNFVPNNAKATSISATAEAVSVTDSAAVGTAASEGVNINTTSAYEVGFVGDLSVKGLTVHYFKNKNSEFDTASNTVEAEGQNYGIKYNFGQFTAGANKKKNAAEGTTDTEITEKAYAVAYAINPDLSIGAIYAKADKNGSTGTHKVKGVNLGYSLGPVNLAVGYAKNKDAEGVAGADNDIFMARLIGAF